MILDKDEQINESVEESVKFFIELKSAFDKQRKKHRSGAMTEWVFSFTCSSSQYKGYYELKHIWVPNYNNPNQEYRFVAESIEEKYKDLDITFTV